MNKSDAVLSAPPVAVAGATFMGYSLPEWAAIVTITYTVILLVKLIRNEWREWKESKK